jgi:hypothetical protein
MKNIYDRQTPLSILVRLTPEDIAGGGFSAKVPHGALVTNVVGLKQTAFNTAGTTPTVTLTVGDGTTTFINAQTLTGTGAITAAVTTKFYPSGGTITGAITEGVASGAITTATAGDAFVRIDYVQVGRNGDVMG